MAQFEVVETLFEADVPLTKQDLISKLDFHPSTVEAGIKDCIDKGYARKTDQGVELVDGFNQEKLESIRPKTIEELRD